MATINAAIEEVAEDAVGEFEEMKVPKTLRRKLKAAMKDQDQPWDKILYELASEKVKNGQDSHG